MSFGSISVVVPHYNRPALVREAIESIVNQTLPPSEILLVDDHSTPANRAALESLSPLATILSTPRNLGPGVRNYAARQARGEWLAFLDDDDLWLPDKLERQVRYLEAHPTCEALGGGMLMVTPGGKREFWGGTETRRLTLADALFYTASMPQALLIRRELFLALGGFDARLRHLEDYEFGIRLLAAGHEMHFLGEPLFLYRRGGREQLSLQWRGMFLSELRVLRTHSRLARRAFGLLGPVRLYARCYKKYGLRRGRLVGRSVWGVGCALEAFFGRQAGQYD